MKKLFTVYYPAMAMPRYEYPSEWSTIAEVHTDSTGHTLQMNVRLNSCNFFVHPATYRKENTLLITYSAEITHTYRQTLTTSFTFSHPADVLPSVLLGSFPRYIITNRDRNSTYYSTKACFVKTT